MTTGGQAGKSTRRGESSLASGGREERSLSADLSICPSFLPSVHPPIQQLVHPAFYLHPHVWIEIYLQYNSTKVRVISRCWDVG